MLENGRLLLGQKENSQPGSPPLPPYQSTDDDAGPWLISLNGHAQADPRGREDTPRNRFNYYVELRKYQQEHEWSASRINSSMFGDTESQSKVARKWVIDQWQKWGIWAKEWPEDGPGAQERWCDRTPICLLSMELGWEIEHLATQEQPADVSKICGTVPPQAMDAPRLGWSWGLVTALASNRLLKRHNTDGFPSTTIGLPTIQCRQDLKSLAVSLPEPVQKLMSTVENWDDLSSPAPTWGRDIFGQPYRVMRAVEADSGDEQRQDMVGTPRRVARTLEAGGARNPGNKGAMRTSGPRVGGARNADGAGIAGSDRVVRGSRRRDPHREPGERTGRQTRGGRVKKASGRARP